MKTIMFCACVLVTCMVQAQEYDDMYFNKKDRTQQRNAARETARVNANESIRFDYPISTNTSAYNTNPEYVARQQSEISKEEEPHFLENYSYTNQQELSKYSQQLNNWNNNALYSNTFFAPSINAWNSPFYSPFNEPLLMGYNANPWCNPGFRSGWSLSFNFGWGNGWNYWGPSSFWNYYWADPFWSFGWNYGWNRPVWNNWGWYGAPVVVVVDSDRRGPVYGKRGARSNNVAQSINSSSNGSRQPYSRPTTDAAQTQRMATGSRSASEYYTPQWRRQPAANESNTTNRSGESMRTTTYDRSTPQRSTGTYNSPAQRSNDSYSSPSRSYSSPSRSSGSSSGSGGTRSSRGRGN